MTNRFDELQAALRAGDDAPFGALVAGSAEVTAEDATGNRLLHLAVRLRRHAAVAALLRAGADVEARNRHYQRTALHYAALEADAAIVDLLVTRGAAVDATDGGGMTPLQWAPTNPHGDAPVEAVIDRLIAAGASVEAAGEGGHRALHRAAFEGSLGGTLALLRAGADPNARTHDGVTALHLAAGNGAGPHAQRAYIALIERLIAAGADADAQSTTGFQLWGLRHAAKRTPLDVARRHRHTDIVAALERLRATR